MDSLIASDEAGNKSAALRYALAVATAAAALLLRRALSPAIGNQFPFLTLWPAVVFSSWYCGVGPSIMAGLLSLAGTWLWFVPFSGSFHLRMSNVYGMIGFLVFSGLIIAMGEANRKANRRQRDSLAGALAATAKFEAVFQETATFAGVLTLDGTLIEANRLSLQMCGYRAEEELGKPFWETGWFHGSKELQQEVRNAVLRAAQGQPSRQIVKYRWADESEHIADFSIHPIRDAGGKVIFLHPSALDITALKRTEELYRTLAETLEAEVRKRTEQLERQSETLRLLSRRLMETRDEERRRLARELHDSAGQLLTALGMSVESILRDVQANSPAFEKKAAESSQLVKQLSREIRTMSYLLHPPLLDEIGLAPALHWYAQGLAERGGLDVALSVPDNFRRLPSDLELVLFRLVQECLTNVYRHSGSKTAAIHMFTKNGKVCLEVQDSGKGIPLEKLREIQTQGSGVGMQGMRERVQQFGGSMDIQSSELGTCVSFAFPVPDQKPEML